MCDVCTGAAVSDKHTATADAVTSLRQHGGDSCSAAMLNLCHDQRRLLTSSSPSQRRRHHDDVIVHVKQGTWRTRDVTLGSHDVLVECDAVDAAAAVSLSMTVTERCT